MVYEIRQIIFTTEELITAFQSFARKTPQFLPSGKLVSCTPIAGDESKIKVKVEATYGDSVNNIELSFKGGDVLQPLILFLIENNIVLPRDGKKAFTVVDNKAMITIDLDMDHDLGPMEAPLTVDQVKKMIAATVAKQSPAQAPKSA